MAVETIKVKCPSCAGNEAGEMLINKSDYDADPSRYELVGAEATPAPMPPDGSADPVTPTAAEGGLLEEGEPPAGDGAPVTEGDASATSPKTTKKRTR